MLNTPVYRFATLCLCLAVRELGAQRGPCDSDSTTGLIACSWTPSYTFTVGSDWMSGLYVAVLTNNRGYQNYAMFVVRDGRPATYLYEQAIATDQAYNNYPNDGRTGKSLYAYNSFGANTIAGDARAVKVSFDRPYADDGSGNFFYWEVDLVRWLERNGYDVTYSTDVDTHETGGALRNSKGFLSAGHDEYWSKEMYDAAEAARDAGVSLGFFGANAIYTQVRYEPSAAGVANRDCETVHVRRVEDALHLGGLHVRHHLAGGRLHLAAGAAVAQDCLAAVFHNQDGERD